jgi:hypothetical protein
MGTCGSKGDYHELNVNSLVRIQTAGRVWLAKKKLAAIRHQKLLTIFSNSWKATWICRHGEVPNNQLRCRGFTSGGQPKTLYPD